MLSINNLSFKYGRRTILDSVSFDAPFGSCVAVLGNNGAGKSTLVKCINKILHPASGGAVLGGRDLFSLSRSALARELAYVAQDFETSRMTVFDSVLLGRKPHMRFGPSEKDLTIVQEVVDETGLQDLALCHIDELSGGELQKVMLARALAQKPRVLLLDEPTSKLDLKKQHEILRLVRECVSSEDRCAIFVIHDLNLALRYCDRFLLLKDGRVLSYGGVETMTPANIAEIYGIPVAIESVRGFNIVVPVPA